MARTPQRLVHLYFSRKNQESEHGKFDQSLGPKRWVGRTVKAPLPKSYGVLPWEIKHVFTLNFCSKNAPGIKFGRLTFKISVWFAGPLLKRTENGFDEAAVIQS